METNNNSWKRLEKIIDWAGLSIHAFAIEIGMNRSENLYRIIRYQKNISIRLMMQIIEKYPQISRNWLSTGEGEMILLRDNVCEIINKIPVYGRNGDKPLYHINAPMFKDAECAILHSDKSMEPIIPAGAVIVLKKSTKDIIVYGQSYYIEANNFSVTRLIRKNDNLEDELILEAINTQNYDNIIIQKNEINNLYIVCGTLTTICY